MLPRGLNRVGGNRLGGRGEENKRLRKRGREEEDNQIVFDGVRILRIHRHLVDESPPIPFSCQRRGCAILSLAFFCKRTYPSYPRTHTSSRLGQTKIQRATRERMRILGGPSTHGVCVCVRDNVSQPSFNPTQGNLETKPPLLSARVGDLTA